MGGAHLLFTQDRSATINLSSGDVIVVRLPSKGLQGQLQILIQNIITSSSGK